MWKKLLISEYYTLGIKVETAFKVTTLIVATLGLLGNSALFYTYWEKDRQCRFNFLMLMTSSFYLVYLITEIVVTSIHLKFFDFYYGYYYNTNHEYIGFIYQFTFGGSVYSLTLLTFERFLDLCCEK